MYTSVQNYDYSPIPPDPRDAGWPCGEKDFIGMLVGDTWEDKFQGKRDTEIKLVVTLRNNKLTYKIN